MRIGPFVILRQRNLAEFIRDDAAIRAVVAKMGRSEAKNWVSQWEESFNISESTEKGLVLAIDRLTERLEHHEEIMPTLAQDIEKFRAYARESALKHEQWEIENKARKAAHEAGNHDLCWTGAPCRKVTEQIESD